MRCVNARLEERLPALAPIPTLLIFGAESASERGYATLSADEVGSPRLQTRLTQAAARIRALKAWLAAHGGASCS